MENYNQNEPQEEEIPNIEQFQVGRNPEETDAEETSVNESDDADYTEDEIEFADGEGTQLDEELGGPDDEDEDEEINFDDDDALEADVDTDLDEEESADELAEDDEDLRL